MKKKTIKEISEYLLKYEVELLSDVYVNNRTPITIRCKNGHITNIRFDNFKRTNNCPKCSRHYGAYTENDVKEYLEAFDYELISNYLSIHEEIIIKCPNNHIYKTSFNSFKSNGCRCGVCTKSKGENKISNILNNYGIKNIQQITFEDCKNISYLPFDFYLPKYNILIEYDGIQHFEPIDFVGRGKEWAEEKFRETQYRDNIKTQYCIDNNIKLIRIPYWNFNNIEKILIKELNLNNLDTKLK